MARKPGHKRAPSAEIPVASPTDVKTKSRSSPIQPLQKSTLFIEETEDEAEPRSQGPEEEEVEAEEEGEDDDDEVRRGRGEDINLEADYNAENDSQEDSEDGSQEVDNEGPQHEHENEHDDGQSEGDEEASGYENPTSAQKGPDVSLLLINLEELDKAATNVIDYFLGNIKEGFVFSPTHLTEVMEIYQHTPEGAASQGIDSQKIASELGIDSSTNGFDPIFQKANLAAFTLLVRNSKEPSYYALGALSLELLKGGCFAGIDDDVNFEFVKELRTQLYIRAMAMQEGVIPEDHPNWPDTILLGAFCDEDQYSQVPFVTTTAFQKNVKAAKLKGWDSMGSEIKPQYKKNVMQHIFYLRTFTKKVNGRPKANLEGLMEEFPYEDFQELYLKWLKEAYLRICQSDPPISWRLEVAKAGARDVENFQANFEQLMNDPSFMENPGSRSPSMIQPSRRTTGASIVEEVSRQEHVESSLRSTSNSRHLDRDLRKRLKKMAQDVASGKPTARSSTGLMLPSTQTQPHPSQDRVRDLNHRHSAPGSIPGSNAGFNINQLLEKAKMLEEKENTVPPTPPKNKRRFNESQADRVAITFSDDNDDSVEPVPPRPLPQAAAVQEVTPPADTEHDTQSADDSDVVPVVAGPSRAKRPRQASFDDEEEESDDFARHNGNAGMRKRARVGDRVMERRHSRFEPKRGAARPEERLRTPPRRPVQPDARPSPQRNQRGPSEEDFGPLFEPLVPRIRRSWSQEEVDTLVRAIAKLGPSWARVRDAYFSGTRTDVNLKDKARNLKFEYLKRGERLPANFEHVTMDVRMLEKLRNSGIHYKNGDLGPRRIRH